MDPLEFLRGHFAPRDATRTLRPRVEQRTIGPAPDRRGALPNAPEPTLAQRLGQILRRNAERSADEFVGAGERAMAGDASGAADLAGLMGPSVLGTFSGKAYHATSQAFDGPLNPSFFGTRTDAGHLGKGAYLSTDPRIAKKGDVTIPFDVELANTLDLSYPEWGTDKRAIIRRALKLPNRSTADDITFALRGAGYDGVVMDYSPVGYYQKELMVIDPLKSTRR